MYSWADETERIEDEEYEIGTKLKSSTQILLSLVMMVELYTNPDYITIHPFIERNLAFSSFTIKGAIQTYFKNASDELSEQERALLIAYCQIKKSHFLNAIDIR